MIPTSSSGMKATSSTREWFSLREEIDAVLRCVQLGFLFSLPLVIAVVFHSLRYFLAIIATEVLGYVIGILVLEFDNWYNSRDLAGINLLQPVPPKTKLEIALKRLEYFRTKYYISLEDMYLYLQNGFQEQSKWKPQIDNLDWVEIVGIINELSLQVGKHFQDEDDSKGKGKQ